MKYSDFKNIFEYYFEDVFLRNIDHIIDTTTNLSMVLHNTDSSASSEDNEEVQHAIAVNRRPSSIPWKRRKKNRDCVQINVGGTRFTTSKRTLCTYSTFFQGKHSVKWNYDDDAIIFLDHDPLVFEILLRFMRRGFIYSSEISHDVLLQADYFGIDVLVKAAKCAFRPLNRLTLYANLSVDEICRIFDKEYGGLVSAIRKGIIPKDFVIKEYANIVIYDNVVSTHFFEDACCRLDTLYTHVEAPAYMVPDCKRGDEISRSEEKKYILKRTMKDYHCSSFLDSLNWLHTYGFVTQEHDFHMSTKGILLAPKVIDGELARGTARCFENLWFSRNASKSALSSLMGDDCPVVIDTPDTSTSEMRQFAALLQRSSGSDDVLIADVGEKKSLHMYDKEDEYWDRLKPITKLSQILLRNSSSQKLWLKRHGYEKVESCLGDIVEKIYKCHIDHEYHEGDDFNQVKKLSSIDLYSRKRVSCIGQPQGKVEKPRA